MPLSRSTNLPLPPTLFIVPPFRISVEKTYKDLNSAQLYAASTTFLNNQHKLFRPEYNTKQPNNIRTQTASYVPEEISVSIKTITSMARPLPTSLSC